MGKRVINPSIYFIVDPSLCGGRGVDEIVMAAVRGGITAVQYRNKSGKMPEILAEAALLCELLKSLDIAFLVNDYVDVAFAVGAAGVHLGQGDASPIEARKRLGPEAIIGQTAFTPAHMAAAEALPEGALDYVGCGPFYETMTDKGKPVLGAEGFEALAELSPVPVVGIGGITPDNALSVMEAGADGVAMMRSISEAQDPEAAARAFVLALSGCAK